MGYGRGRERLLLAWHGSRCFLGGRSGSASSRLPRPAPTCGVALATPRQPRRSNRSGDASMRHAVVMPVASATSPRNEVKALRGAGGGAGHCAAVQVPRVHTLLNTGRGQTACVVRCDQERDDGCTASPHLGSGYSCRRCAFHANSWRDVHRPWDRLMTARHRISSEPASRVKASRRVSLPSRCGALSALAPAPLLLALAAARPAGGSRKVSPALLLLPLPPADDAGCATPSLLPRLPTPSVPVLPPASRPAVMRSAVLLALGSAAAAAAGTDDAALAAPLLRGAAACLAGHGARVAMKWCTTTAAAAIASTTPMVVCTSPTKVLPPRPRAAVVILSRMPAMAAARLAPMPAAVAPGGAGRGRGVWKEPGGVPSEATERTVVPHRCLVGTCGVRRAAHAHQRGGTVWARAPGAWCHWRVPRTAGPVITWAGGRVMAKSVL